ncbi:hypothetical protein DXG03_008525 [Asterophora parasitica]|uniref:GH16 domain-containing protein n=1 Tax=Asterophora parasitica TaxID=117018 RepID=A0A9P7KD10_9AGAR|nr:hypothetical protein DXG03_008525 [Asterophora parasitica]
MSASSRRSLRLYFADPDRPSMASRPQSWVNDYEDVDFDPSFTNDNTPSGRNSPHERQRMLANAGDEGALPTRLPYAMRLDTAAAPIASSSTGTRASHSQSRPSIGVVPQHTQDFLPFERPRSTGPELPPPNPRVPRVSSYKSIASSPLNPSFPSGPPLSPGPLSPPILSPFARPGSRGSAHITRIPSEDSRVLALGTPFAMGSLNHQSSRGSMILYRRAEEDFLQPPTLPHAGNRNSTISISGDSFVSLSSDSKYPAGIIMPERGLVAYAYDPSYDENEPLDEEDNLHDPDSKLAKVAGRPMSWRGVKNLSALVLMVAGLLALFVVYPVYLHYNDDGKMQLIVGNTRINSSGQASATDFDTREMIERRRAQMPLVLLSGLIDPATPSEAWTRTSRDGVVYYLVFSDEFNTNGRTFTKGADPFWEAVNDESHASTHTTTRDGYLVSPSYPIGSGARGTRRYTSDILHQKSSLCLEGGFVEISAVIPPTSTHHRISWTGTWTNVIDNVPDAPQSGSSLSESTPIWLSIGSGGSISTHEIATDLSNYSSAVDPSTKSPPAWFTTGHSELAIDYVRYYQKAGSSSSLTTCKNGDAPKLEFFADIF